MDSFSQLGQHAQNALRVPHRDLVGLQKGYTLAELMVGLAIAAVLAAFAVPGVAGLLREANLSSATNELLGSLYFARSEAVKRKTRVTLCSSLSGSDCTRATGWGGGWIVFEDADGNALRSETEQILLVAHGPSATLAITGSQPVKDYVSYVPSGETRLRGGGLQMGTITICDRGAGKQIVISATGRARVIPKVACG